MKFDWDAELEPHMRPNPVVHYEVVDFPDDVPEYGPDDILKIFRTEGANLKTWNRAVDRKGNTVLKNDPHWLCVRRGTPLHTDPKYPRYSHQLKLYVGEGVISRGYNKEAVDLKRGVFYILDTHSPHQVYHTKRGREHDWNLSVSIDHSIVLPVERTRERLIEYARTVSLFENAP